jgi:hypothetical protein
VLQNQEGAEYGHSSGGQFNTILKSGTNTFHGTAYEYLQNRNLNAIDQQVQNQALASGLRPSNPRSDNNRFGGSFGGPIKKDKLFFFGLYDSGGSLGAHRTGFHQFVLHIRPQRDQFGNLQDLCEARGPG